MSKCSICGEPMPPGEEMFKFHGASGPCPAPPKPRVSFSVEIKGREDGDGALWLDAYANGQMFNCVGPFDTEGERKRASDDLLEMLKSVRPN